MDQNSVENIRPLFIVGSPRSGTTVVAKAIDSLDEFYLPHMEGHMLYWLLEGIKKVVEKPDVYVQQFLPTSICTGDNFSILKQWIARAIDQFEREVGKGDQLSRWIDKTPDMAQIRILPTLFDIFPNSQAIFTYRHPRDIVLSTKKVWQPNVSDKDLLLRWKNLHKEYREIVRPQLDQKRIIEIKQEDIVTDPRKMGIKIGKFLDVSKESQIRIADFLANRRINRVSDTDQDQFTYKDDVSDKFNNLIKKLCKDEMKKWGYRV